MAEELVYLIQRGHEFKIGHTKNLKRRLVMLSTGSAIKLKVVHTIQTDRNVELEDRLKVRFAANRLNGEWFALNDSAVRYICAITTWPIDGTDLPLPSVGHFSHHKTARRIMQSEISFDYVADVKELDIHMTLRELRDLLISKGITRPIEFARKTGLSRQYAHALWSGDRLVSRKMARRLAPILEVSPETLVMLERPSK